MGTSSARPGLLPKGVLLLVQALSSEVPQEPWLGRHAQCTCSAVMGKRDKMQHGPNLPCKPLNLSWPRKLFSGNCSLQSTVLDPWPQAMSPQQGAGEKLGGLIPLSPSLFILFCS